MNFCSFDRSSRNNEALFDRVFELPCYYRHGIFDQLPDGMTAEQHVRLMKDAALDLRGAAGEYFIATLVKKLAKNPDRLKRKLSAWREQADVALDPNQSPRARGAFACVFAAGCLANEFGILPWDPDRLLAQTRRVFADHIGFVKGEHAKFDPVEMMVSFYRVNKGKFLKINASAATSIKDSQLNKVPGVILKLPDGTRELCMLPLHFAKVYAPHERRAATKVLKKKGVLKVDAKDGKPSKRSLGKHRPRCSIRLEALTGA